ADSVPGWLRLDTPQIAVFAILLQVMQSLVVGYHAKWNDLALTVAPRRDHFSVAGYSDWMKTWLQAGEALRAVAKPSDRIWVGQGMAPAGLTDSYLRDQFYAAPRWSKFEEYRACSSEDCLYSLSDYILTFPGADRVPRGFETMKTYSNIQILRRVANS